MLLIGSIWLGLLIAGTLPGQFALAFAPMVVGTTLAALEWRLRRPAFTAFLALLTLEELCLWWALTSGNAFYSAEARLRVGPLLAGVCVVALLLTQARLPERGLPLRGIWLRRFLAASALLALIAWPSWLYLFTRAAAAGVLVWPVLPCVLIALWYIFRSADTLARHSLQQTNGDLGPTN